MSFRAVTFAECSRWSSQKTQKHPDLCSVNQICVNPYSRPIFANTFQGCKTIFIVVDKWEVNSHFAWQLFWLLAFAGEVIDRACTKSFCFQG